jgi:nicotinamide-nucleotide amidase
MNGVEIVAIGNEILTGRIVDSNSNWLAQAITALGGEVTRCVAVRDRVEEIAKEIRTAMENGSKVAITTGGLGPTFDDRTLEAVAQALNRPLVLHAEALDWIVEKYQDLKTKGYVDGDDITPVREKMAHLPDGSTPLPNTIGAAPGVMVEAKGCTIFSLPGVPDEMKAIFEDSMLQRLRAMFSRNHFVERNITTDVGDESQLVPVINEVMKQVEGVHLKSKPTHFGKDVQIGIRITTTGPDEAVLENKIHMAIQELEHHLGKLGRVIIDYEM